jgi:hypothetical protein
MYLVFHNVAGTVNVSCGATVTDLMDWGLEIQVAIVQDHGALCLSISEALIKIRFHFAAEIGRRPVMMKMYEYMQSLSQRHVV